jgi:hypothetical protein
MSWPYLWPVMVCMMSSDHISFVKPVDIVMMSWVFLGKAISLGQK